jgi:hypothetical protein
VAAGRSQPGAKAIQALVVPSPRIFAEKLFSCRPVPHQDSDHHQNRADKVRT